MAHVLLIEDDPTLSEMYVVMLTMKQHVVHRAKNGSEGLVMAADLHPEVILLDMMMPVLNGMETLKHLKGSQELKHIPVAMLSNLADEQQAALALEQGAAQYVIKSDCSAESLNQLISGMLEKK